MGSVSRPSRGTRPATYCTDVPPFSSNRSQLDHMLKTLGLTLATIGTTIAGAHFDSLTNTDLHTVLCVPVMFLSSFQWAEPDALPGFGAVSDWIQKDVVFNVCVCIPVPPIPGFNEWKNVGCQLVLSLHHKIVDMLH
jgi:hypothetical protein